MAYGGFKAFLSVSRANLLLASIGHATIGLFLGAGSVVSLFCISVPLFIALHYTIALMACNLNSLSDYNVDRKYKKYMSDGVDVIGKQKLSLITVTLFLVSCLLTACLFSLGHFLASVTAVIGLAAAISYSLEPVRIKRRGFWSPFPVWIGLYMMPLLGGWFLFQNTLSLLFIVFVLGYAFINEGITLVNTVEDHTEDRNEGIVTWSHVLGMKSSLDLAFLFSALGLLTLFSLVLMFPAVSMVSLALLLLAAASILAVIRDVARVRKASDLEKSAKRHAVKMARWFMMVRYPLMLAAFSFLL